VLSFASSGITFYAKTRSQQLYDRKEVSDMVGYIPSDNTAYVEVISARGYGEVYGIIRITERC
jgi:hypothetical protein